MKRLGVFYREKVLSLPKEALELKEMPSFHLADTRVEKDLFGWKLTYNKRRSIRDSIKCRSEEEARYIKALNDSGFPDIFVPKDDVYIKSILPELEYLKMRADEIIDRYVSGIFSRMTRLEVTSKVFAELRDDASTGKLAAEIFPELKDVLWTDYDIDV